MHGSDAFLFSCAVPVLPATFIPCFSYRYLIELSLPFTTPIIPFLIRSNVEDFMSNFSSVLFLYDVITLPEESVVFSIRERIY